MMSKQFFIGNLFCRSGSLIIFLLLSINAFSAEEAKKIKGPIIITSKILTADNKAHTALFEKSVVAGHARRIAAANEDGIKEE